MDNNQSIWGLDLAEQPNNLAALLAGRASGQPTISAPFILKQDKERSGFMLRLPVFLETPSPGALRKSAIPRLGSAPPSM